ncbi:basic helix-loop-helix protein [Coemansia sp. RSA 552]|nr:basic helix-loop-helix protein [Coemansia sp. RSA 552]
MSEVPTGDSVLLAVEEKASARSGQYPAIAPRAQGAGGVAMGATSDDGAPLASALSSTSETTEDKADEGAARTPRRKRGSNASAEVEAGSPEWHRMRRDSHKEVERRRREVINKGIDRLAELVPGAEKNKGRIIAQAVDYIDRMKVNEQKNIEKWTIEKLLADQAISELTNQVEQLKSENKALRVENNKLQDTDAAEEEDNEARKHRSLDDAGGRSAAAAADEDGNDIDGGSAKKSKSKKKRKTKN